MLIGDLPFGYDPKKNDIIVFSKDGVHLLKIKYDDFVRNVGITVPTVSYTDLVVGEKTKVGELKVGENTYDVNVPPGGGGGSSDPYTRTRLYTGGTWSGATGTITLDDSILNYDEIEFVVVDKNGYFRSSHYFNSEYFHDTFTYIANPTTGDNSHPNALICIYSTSYVRAIMGDANNKLQIYQASNCFVSDIYGIKYASGLEGMVYTGSSAPSNSLGSNGDLYLQRTTSTSYKYLRFEIYGKKGSNQFTQLSELQFIDSNDVAYDWTNARVHSNIYNYNASQVTQNLISGSTVDVALWQYSPTDQAPIRCDIDCFEPIDLSIYSTYQLWTAGDAEVRDPARWRLSASNDKQNWVELDYVPTYSMPSARNAIGYAKNIASSVSNIDSTFIYKKYYKESDRWIPIL